jgi:hypothetical protein
MKLPILEHLPLDLIEAALLAAPGNELDAKFFSPCSSAALAANTFGRFLDRPELLRAMPGVDGVIWDQVTVQLEKTIRFGWRGGKHPCLDVRIDTFSHLIGIESKRFEPYRSPKPAEFSDRFAKEDVWHKGMRGYEGAYKRMIKSALEFGRVDACQLTKHALALWNEARRMRERGQIRQPVLVYLRAEPTRWVPDGPAISAKDRESHRDSLADFASTVVGDDVQFVSLTYSQLLDAWDVEANSDLSFHTQAIRAEFGVDT